MAAVMQKPSTPKERPEELRLTYPHGGAVPAPGEVIEVADGVWWLRMTLPFALDHINLWLLRDGDGFSIIDCGVALPETRGAWDRIFAEVIGEKKVKRVVVTHAHPDHVGNASWLCARTGAPMVTTAGEYYWARIMNTGMTGFDNDAQVGHFRRHGLGSELLAEIEANRREYYSRLVPDVALSFNRVRDGEAIMIDGRAWRVLCGFGHSAEHISLFCAELNVLVSGDMLLPRISTNIGVWPNEPSANPLRQFLDSIARYTSLPEDVLVLPSHGRVFGGAHERVKQLNEHHEARLAETLAACDTPKSATDIIPVMFGRKLDAHQTVFAIGEALAHLHFLRDAGSLRQVVSADGVVRFERA